ncbi:unnamed protein product, partial [Meganyctiphanes norvegica]
MLLSNMVSHGTWWIWSWMTLALVTLKVRSFTLPFDNNTLTRADGDSSSKFFPLFTVVNIANNMCTVGDQMGTCVTWTECLAAGGTKIGHCSKGLGTCCY